MIPLFFHYLSGMFQDLLYYPLGPGVEAFTTRRDSVLPYPVIHGHQVHGSRVAIVDRPDMTREDLEGYDAFTTNLPGVAIGVRTADCVPILLYDPGKRVIAAIHSGWKGTLSVKSLSETIFPYTNGISICLFFFRKKIKLYDINKYHIKESCL